MSWAPGFLDDSLQLPLSQLQLPPPPHPLRHPPLSQPQPSPRTSQGPAESQGQAREAVVAVGVEGPMASSPGPVWLPAASAGLPSQLPGAIPPPVGELAPGGAQKEGPPVGEDIMVAGPCCPCNLQHQGRWSWIQGSAGRPYRKRQKDSFLRD